MPGPDDYSDAPPATAGGGDGDSERTARSTALLNKAVLAGYDSHPGAIVKLRIVAEHGDEVEVECAEGDSGKEAETDSSMPEESDGMYD